MELFQQFPNFSVAFAFAIGGLFGYFVGKIRAEKKANKGSLIP